MHGLLGKQLGEHLQQKEAARVAANPSTHAASRSQWSIVTSTRTYAARRISREYSMKHEAVLSEWLLSGVAVLGDVTLTLRGTAD